MPKDTYIYSYGSHDISYDVWLSQDTSKPHTLLLLGVVQTGRIAEHVAENCPPGVAIVEGAKHWFVANDGHDIATFMVQYTYDAVRNIFKKYHPERVNVIAESQAAPCAIALAQKPPIGVSINNIVLVQPLGLNQDAYGKDIGKIIKTFKSRTIKNARHQIGSLLIDQHLRRNHLQLVRYVHFNNPVAAAQYGAGLSYDASSVLQKIALNHQIAIVCGQNDTIFPPDEIRRTLERLDLDIPVIVVPGVPHSPLATKFGQRLLRKAFDIIDIDMEKHV